MNINDYQKQVTQFAIYPGAGKGEFPEVNYLILGLVSEAGEVAGKWKKFIRDGKFNEEAFLAEVGDVFWYASQLCSSAGVTVESVLQYNFDKLSKRKETNTIQGSGDTREQEALASANAG